MKSTSSTTKIKAHFGRTEVRLARIFLLLMVLAGGAQLIMGQNPDSITLLPCPFHSLIGVQCPGCGMTRACLAISQGDVSSAWHFHPFAFLLVSAALLVAALPTQTNAFFGTFSNRQRNTSIAILIASVLLFWLYRLAAGWLV